MSKIERYPKSEVLQSTLQNLVYTFENKSIDQLPPAVLTMYSEIDADIQYDLWKNTDKTSTNYVKRFMEAKESCLTMYQLQAELLSSLDAGRYKKALEQKMNVSRRMLKELWIEVSERTHDL